MSENSDAIILGCWIAFILYWIVSAQKVKAIAEKQSLSSALKHRIPVGLGWFLLAIHGLPPPFDLRVTPRTDTTQIIGAAICMAGLFVILWARWTLAGNWSSDVTFKPGLTGMPGIPFTPACSSCASARPSTSGICAAGLGCWRCPSVFGSS